MTSKGFSCPRPDVLVALDEGVLPEELAAAVRDHLNSCRTCDTLRRDLHAPVFTEPSPQELAALEASVFPATAAQKRTRYWMLAGIAASLVLTIALWRVRQNTPSLVEQPSGEQSAASPAVAFRLPLVKPPVRLSLQDSVVFRGQDQNPREAYLMELGKALDPYRNDRFVESAALMEELTLRYPDAPEPLFYGGVALLMGGDASAAQNSLLQAKRVENDVLKDDIAWYLAIAYERNGSWDSAEPLLNELCRGEGTHKAGACAMGAK